MSMIKHVWVAEKPLVANAIIRILCHVKRTKSKRENGYTLLETGDAVVPLFGHMIEMAKPNEYLKNLPKEKQENMFSFLPLIPEPFRFIAKKERTKDGKEVEGRQIRIVEKLVRKASLIINACDIDREGQLIFDELIEFFGMDPAASNIKRMVINSMADEDLVKSVHTLEENGSPKWVNVRHSAAARQKMDWLLGMNASMAMQQLTGIRTMSVGRVQTPVLAMVVLRDMEIDSFKKQEFYVPVIHLADGTQLRWEKRLDGDAEPGFDSSGRIIDKSIAQGILNRITAGLRGVVSHSVSKITTENPPLPFSMGKLQTQVSKKYDLTLGEVTAAAKGLYETHKAITYIGTDCDYLPEAMHADGAALISLLSPAFGKACLGADAKLVSRAFDDSKLDEHFAIIPTKSIPQRAALTDAEAKVYEAIVLRYLAQFYPAYKQQKHALHVVFGKDEFRAHASQDIEPGWRLIEPKPRKVEAQPDQDGVLEIINTVESLSRYKMDSQIVARGGNISIRETTPPTRYTEDTLIEDMESAGKFSKNEEEREILKNSKGIGTSRTRDVVIANLVKRNLLEKRKRKGTRREEIISTKMAQEMIGRLPPWLTDVATTARWEMIFGSISKGEVEAEAAVQMQVVNVVQVIERIRRQQK